MESHRRLASVVLLLPMCLDAQPIPSEVQSREWTEERAGQNVLISDKYIDYKRDANIVFRTIERTMTTTSKRDQPITRVSQHLIEFVADANVFAMMGLDQASALNWNLTSDTPVHFSSGLSERAGWRFIHVCVPKYDYYEYLEVKGTEIKMPLAGKDSYLGAKRDFFRATEAGYIHKLKDYKLAE